MWRNPGEIPGNGIDDDDNGFLDDVWGYDFAADRFGDNDSDPMDIDSHGTHVAGIMAAVGDNATGVCGVSWNARIMALKGFRPDLHIYDSDCIEAIDYAVMMKRDRGVNVVAINASFGGGGENPLQKDAIAEAGRPRHRLRLRGGQRRDRQRRHPLLPGGLRPGQHHLRGRQRRGRRAGFILQLRGEHGRPGRARGGHPLHGAGRQGAGGVAALGERRLRRQSHGIFRADRRRRPEPDDPRLRPRAERGRLPRRRQRQHRPDRARRHHLRAEGDSTPRMPAPSAW